MENILTIRNKFKISFLLYIFIILSILTASFKNILIIFTLITIHELGHGLMASILGIKIDKIILYPLGGLTKINMPINTSIFKELLILINGPLFQQLAYYLLLLIFKEEKELIKNYHVLLLVFNLLPIYPLDGGKLVLLLLELLLPFKRCLNYIIFISYLIVIFLFIRLNIYKLNILITFIFILIIITKEINKKNHIFNKFILERYLTTYNYRIKTIVKKIDDFYKNRNHIIIDDNKYYLEKEYLQKLFKKY